MDDNQIKFEKQLIERLHKFERLDRKINITLGVTILWCIIFTVIICIHPY